MVAMVVTLDYQASCCSRSRQIDKVVVETLGARND